MTSPAPSVRNAPVQRLIAQWEARIAENAAEPPRPARHKGKGREVLVDGEVFVLAPPPCPCKMPGPSRIPVPTRPRSVSSSAIGQMGEQQQGAARTSLAGLPGWKPVHTPRFGWRSKLPTLSAFGRKP